MAIKWKICNLIRIFKDGNNCTLYAWSLVLSKKFTKESGIKRFQNIIKKILIKL